MNWINRNKYCFNKMMSSRPKKQLIGLLIVLLFIMAVVAICAVRFDNRTGFWTAIGSFLSPVPMYTHGFNYLRFTTYLFGTIIFSGVIVALFTNLIRTTGERHINGTASYKFKNHVLFLGYDEMMIGTLRQELKKDTDGIGCDDLVVAVPNHVEEVRNIIYQYLSKDNSKHVFVIQASRVSVDDLKKVAQVATAKKIYIIGQPDEETHDAVNLKCLGLLAALIPGRPDDNPVPCYYYLRNQSTFYLIHRMKYKAEDFRKDVESARLYYDKDVIDRFIKASEPFNFYESIARHVLFGNTARDKDALQLNASKRDPHLIIYGMTPMGTALMRDVLMTQHFPDRRLHVTMVDENAEKEMHYLIGRHRPFFENCRYGFRNLNDSTQDTPSHAPATSNFLDVDMEFIQGDVAHPKLAEYLRKCVVEEGDALTIAICTLDSPQNMALALYMPRQVFEAKVPIWVFQTGDNSMNAFVENDDKENLYSSIRVFSTVDYGISDRGSSWQWQLAKAVGEDYAKKYPDEVGPDYRWEFSQPKDRWSSLNGAISKIAMLRNIGKIYPPILLTKEEVKALSKAEHNRWNTEKLLNGWVPAQPGEEKTLFVHNKIIPYKDLDEDTKAKDFEQLEAVVKKLNQKGREFKG